MSILDYRADSQSALVCVILLQDSSSTQTLSQPTHASLAMSRAAMSRPWGRALTLAPISLAFSRLTLASSSALTAWRNALARHSDVQEGLVALQPQIPTPSVSAS